MKASLKIVVIMLILGFFALNGCDLDGGSGGGGGGGESDTTAPAEVTSLRAVHEDSRVSLSWDNPADTDFKETMIRRSDTDYPADTANGDEVYVGSGTTVNDIGLTNDTPYYYTIFTCDNSGNYSTGEQISITPHEPVVVAFPDMNFENAVRVALGIPSGDIYDNDCAGLLTLNASGSSIADLTGIDAFISLEELDLSSAGLTEASETGLLSDLTRLVSLDLDNNSITIIPDLSNCLRLKELYLSNNSLSALTPLSSLTWLEHLNIVSTGSTDISALSSLTGVTRLDLAYNAISDFGPITSLPNLVNLGVSDNGITTLSAFSGMTNLEYFKADSNSLSDISAVGTMTNLDVLVLQSCGITDVSSLSSITSVSYLHLRDNGITDLEPLVDNTGLGAGTFIDVEENPLSDTSKNTYIPALQARGVTVTYTD